jgi:hypothetical protein
MPPPPAAIQWLVQSANDRPTIREEEKMTSSRRASVRTVLAIILGIVLAMCLQILPAMADNTGIISQIGANRASSP